MQGRTLRILLAAGAAFLGLLVLGHVVVGLYTEILWYVETGYLGTYWTRLALRIGVRSAAGAVGAALIFVNLWWVARHLGPVRVRRRYGNIEIAEQIPRNYVTAISVAVAVLGGWWLAELQFGDDGVLGVAAWARHASWGVVDPLFGHDVAFYVFTVPFLADVLAYLILTSLWTLVLVSLGYVLVGGVGVEENRLTSTRTARLHAAGLLAAMLVLLGVRYWLGRYLLVVDGTGVGGGLGYTDIHARLPGYWILAGLALAAAAALLYGAWTTRLLPPVLGLGTLLVGGALVAVAYPGLVQKFQVEPNELSREAPYIRWNMEFTRRAYGLEAMARVPFPYRRDARPTSERVEPLRAHLPLWDPAPLERAFNEVQSLFPYFWFPDVDFDRYGPPGAEQQVGIGVREFQPSGLETGAQTWQSLRLNPSYIRGMGVVAAPAHPQEGSSGPPDLWIRNVNPAITDPAAPPELELREPSVFFGETMDDYVVLVPGRDSAFTGRAGVDYPEGIQLGSFFRVLAFAWRFGDETLLFSGDVTRDSRLLFRRSVRERVESVAPFLLWDSDPLPIIENGRVVWMLDGYTVSRSYPLARAVTVGRQSVRYLRSSVKATVDAVTGDVAFYGLRADDPLLETYRRIFPGLIRPMDAMPAGLRRHLRYPELALVTQAEVLQEYHLQRAETFYSGQDVWERPQDATSSGAMRPYRPLYGMLPVPLERRLEFLALVPFIARGRQNMTAVLTARNDPAAYGELTLYEFPRDQQIPGPGQVLAMTEQDPVISPELTLLRQRGGGSGVDLGQIRVVPLDSMVLYVQPLYLSAEANPIPELVRVVVSDGRAVVMAGTLAAAMAQLELPVSVERQPGAAPRTGGWAGRALDLLERADARLREGDWAGYGRVMNELRAYLQTMDRERDGTGG